MLRFLFKAAHDPRFNSDIIMNEIRLVSANNYGNGELSFIDRQIYRYLLIPFTKKALLKQEKAIACVVLSAPERCIANYPLRTADATASRFLPNV